jgi:tetratricopeptide (TPR) repeat protein
MRPTGVASVWLAVILCGTAGAGDTNLSPPNAPFRTPYLPSNDSEVLQEVPSTADPAVLKMQTLRAALDAAPHDLTAAEQLADAYVDYSRQVGDAHYAGYAEAAIAPWVQAAVAPALVIQATILQYRHQFDEARALLQRALESDPQNAQAWLILATLDMVQGNYQAANRDCARVAKGAGAEIGLACFGSLRSYIGKARQSLSLLQQVESSGRRGSASYRAWVEGLIAESDERLGDWPDAETHYLEALKLQPRDNFLLVAYADFLLDRGRPQEVLPLLVDHAQSDTAFLRLALAQSLLHSDQTQRYIWIMAARFEALRLRGSEYFGREESRFALQLQHDPHTALDMALRNWQLQRAPWDARVVLEAALASEEPQAAEPVLEFLQKTQLEDPILEPLERELRSQLSASSGASQ